MHLPHAHGWGSSLIAASSTVLGKKNGGISPCSLYWPGGAVAAMLCNTECSKRVIGKP